MTSTLAYWNLRGLAHPIRLLLTYAGERFEDKIYIVSGAPPNQDRSNWLKEKFTHNLDFPNLPYYIDGKVRLTQSPAILRYLARKYKLNGKSEEEIIRVDLLESQLYDLRGNFFKLCNSPDFEQLKVDYLNSLPDTIRQLSTFLGPRKYFASDNLTYVDFLAYEYLYQQQLFRPRLIDGITNLQGFYERFEILPRVSDYIKTSAASKYPPNSRMRQLLKE